MNHHEAPMRNMDQTGGRIAGHMVALILGFTLMLVGMGMGVTMVLLPLGLPIGLVGFLMFLWGLNAQIQRQRDEEQGRLPTNRA
ncbi:hypothetical protein BH23PLA1_BH23PLA1_26360 [soil metagenome]